MPQRDVRDGPYWSPPEIEHERMQQIRECASTDLPNPTNVVFLIGKSSNRNFAFYEYHETATDFGIRARWGMLEQPRGSKEALTLEEMNTAEQLLMGVSVTPRPNGAVTVSFSPEQLRGRDAELILDAAGKPALTGVVQGRACRLLYAYVQMRKSVLPDVEYISLYGKSLEDGSVLCERLQNEGAANSRSWLS